MVERRRRLQPFYTPESRRLAVCFAVVYFAQGIWMLPTQALKMTLKDQAFSASAIETFFALGALPWLLKPLYGLLSDFVPIGGQRRKPYLMMGCALAAASGLTLGLSEVPSYATLLALVAAMTVGFAFSDVLVDGLMVDKGRPSGLTGPFQAVQWGAARAAAVLVGVVGGHLAATRDVHSGYLVAGVCPLVSLVMVAGLVEEPRQPHDRDAARRTLRGIRDALRSRDLWAVAGFLFLWTFSPSFDTALLFQQTDRLHFSQRFIGVLGSVGSIGGMIGAFIYPVLSRRVRLRRLVTVAIGIGVVTTLAYLGYRDATTAIVIEAVYGVAGTVATLAFFELAAKAAPRHVEATFFALLMAVYAAGSRVSGVTGGALYDALGYPPLVVISAVVTAAAWLVLPWLDIDGLEARALAAVQEPASAAKEARPGPALATR